MIFFRELKQCGFPMKMPKGRHRSGFRNTGFLSRLYFLAQHRCIALLYRIPLGNFNCVIPGGSSGAFNVLAEALPLLEHSDFFGKGNLI